MDDWYFGLVTKWGRHFPPKGLIKAAFGRSFIA